ncbi:MAG: SDR family oxidoreductase, partial [Cellulomonadaceae bacterium]|nr:SDR family oxidoreductase [Cellulomonadaceae bacterium]
MPDQPAATAPAMPTWDEVITPGRFTGQTVIVTGAASGIGRAVASRAAREGGTVIAADITADALDALKAELADLPDGAALIPVVGDITVQADIDRIVAAANGRVDALVNNAGIMDNMGACHEIEDALWNKVMAVNVTGTMMLSRAVLPLMLDVKSGSIVNVSSEAGLRGSAAGAAYTASKHAVNGLTKSMAVMYMKHGIRVNAVAPGGTATGISIPGF